MGHPERFVQTLRACGAEKVTSRDIDAFTIGVDQGVRYRNMEDGGNVLFDVKIDGVPLSIKGEGAKEKQLPSSFRLTAGTARHNAGLISGLQNGAQFWAVIGVAPYKREVDAPMLAWVGDLAPVMRQVLANNGGNFSVKFATDVGEHLLATGQVSEDDPRLSGYARGTAPGVYVKYTSRKSGKKFGHCFDRGTSEGVLEIGEGRLAYPDVVLSTTGAGIAWEEVHGNFYEWVRERLPARIDGDMMIG